jgi:hypothetical protein
MCFASTAFNECALRRALIGKRLRDDGETATGGVPKLSPVARLYQREAIARAASRRACKLQEREARSKADACAASYSKEKRVEIHP